VIVKKWHGRLARDSFSSFVACSGPWAILLITDAPWPVKPGSGDSVLCHTVSFASDSGYTGWRITLFREEMPSMADVIHTSKVKIFKEKGPKRQAYIEGFETPVIYGVHGGIKKFYGVEPEEEHPATLDHLVAAVAG
jgi:hypothetical protein